MEQTIISIFHEHRRRYGLRRVLAEVCFIGIGFYRSRDKKTIQTSLAQIFNENGQGVILRGTPVVEDKDDRKPHLTYDQLNILLKML